MPCCGCKCLSVHFTSPQRTYSFWSFGINTPIWSNFKQNVTQAGNRRGWGGVGGGWKVLSSGANLIIVHEQLNKKLRRYPGNATVMKHNPPEALVIGWVITKTRLFKYLENFTTKNWKFSDKNSDIFHISAQNIDCGYSLEPRRF